MSSLFSRFLCYWPAEFYGPGRRRAALKVFRRVSGLWQVSAAKEWRLACGLSPQQLQLAWLVWMGTGALIGRRTGIGRRANR
jgi:hypothetical protein